MKRLLIGLLAVVTLLQCSSSDPLSPARGEAFVLHALADSTLKIGDVLTEDPADLALDLRALVSSSDIRFYDGSSHIFYLKGPRSGILPSRTRDGLFPAAWWGRPFVVSTGGEAQYAGAFYSVAQIPVHPVAFIEDIGQYPDDVIHLSWIWPFLADGREDSEVREALAQEGLLHGGLSLALEEVQVLANSDTSTVRYTFELLNVDVDDLYTIDPEKMGPEAFHFFVNGPILLNEGENRDYRAEYRDVRVPEPFDRWEPSWFTRIGAGESIRREVLLKGYPQFTQGRYRAQLRYSGPLNIPQEERNLEDGRYWLGPVDSQAIDLVLP